MKLSRRSLARALAGAPLLAAASAGLIQALLGPRPAAAADDEGARGPEPTPLARFLSRHEEGLSSEERRRVRREVTQLEESLKAVREFPLGNDVPPAGTFRALPSRRGREGR